MTKFTGLPEELVQQITSHLDRSDCLKLCQGIPIFYSIPIAPLWQEVHFECNGRNDSELVTQGYGTFDLALDRRWDYIRTLVIDIDQRQDRKCAHNAVKGLSALAKSPTLPSLGSLQNLAIDLDSFLQLGPGLERLTIRRLALKIKDQETLGNVNLSQLSYLQELQLSYPEPLTLEMVEKIRPCFSRLRALICSDLTWVKDLWQFTNREPWVGVQGAPELLPHLRHLIEEPSQFSKAHERIVLEAFTDFMPNLHHLRLFRAVISNAFKRRPRATPKESRVVKRIEMYDVDADPFYYMLLASHMPIALEHLSMRTKVPGEMPPVSRETQHGQNGPDGSLYGILRELSSDCVTSLRIVELRSPKDPVQASELEVLWNLPNLELFAFDYCSDHDVRLLSLSSRLVMLCKTTKLRFVSCTTVPTTLEHRSVKHFKTLGNNVVKGPTVLERERRQAKRQLLEHQESLIDHGKEQDAIMNLLSILLLRQVNGLVYANVSYTSLDRSSIPGFNAVLGSDVYTASSLAKSSGRRQCRKITSSDRSRYPTEMAVLEYRHALASWQCKDSTEASRLQWHT